MNVNMYFLIKNNELLAKYNDIWENLKSIMKKEFDSEPVNNEKYLTAKIKSYNGKINTNFHNNKIPKEGFQCFCLSNILIDSVFTAGKHYYPQEFVEECKYALKEKRCQSLLLTMMPKFITNNIEIFDDSERKDSDEGISIKKNSDEEIFDEEN